jgi:hypothetical protein
MMSTDANANDEAVFRRIENLVIFKQTGEKIDMDTVSDDQYFAWLDSMIDSIGNLVNGAEIAEKPDARSNPPLNTAVYYDTEDYALLGTGSLLRTSCNKITHAFCAFKLARNDEGVRKDHRYMFAGDEKKLIQDDPTQPAAAALVRDVLGRDSEATPGPYLYEHYGITPEMVSPVLRLDNYRYGFYVWLDKKDALRCSLDRASVTGLRHPDREGKFSEVELAVYPRISEDVASDPRVQQLMAVLSNSLKETFGVETTRMIKYQRAASVLGLL